MNSRIIRIVLMMFFLVTSAKAQITFNAGLHADVTGSSIPYFSNRTFAKLGFSAGAIITGGEDWNIVQLEINYTQKGALRKPDTITWNLGVLHLNYLEFPLTYRYNDLLLPGLHTGYLEVGLSYGQLLSSRLYIDNLDQEILPGTIRRFDLSFIAGLGVHMGDHFLFRTRFNFSFHPVLKRNPVPREYNPFRPSAAYNSMFQFGLAYMFLGNDM